MPITVFYSWQTDTSPKTNRNFIEEALVKGIRIVNADAQLVPATRDEVQLDKDTAGLPGTPAIVDAILSKIDRCTVFVPDVTFVAKTKEGKLTPNSNVLIEYGWALKSRSRERIVPVMNEVFGAAIVKTPAGEVAKLPFNMRHLTRPIAYNYDGNEPPARVRNQLADRLARAIRVVLDKAPIEAASEPKFKATPPTYQQSVFFEPGETLAGEGRARERGLSVPEQGPKMFLRLIPTVPSESLTISKAFALLTPDGQRLEPLRMRRVHGGGPVYRNRRGAVVCGSSGGHNIEEMTQLLLNRELWGISYELIEQQILPSISYEDAFSRALTSYIRFAKESLELVLPLRVIAGLTGVEGFQMAVRLGSAGETVEPDIVGEVMVEDWNTPPEQILLPFFKQVWEAFGLERP